MFLLLFLCLCWLVEFEELWCELCGNVAGRSSAGRRFGLTGWMFAAAPAAGVVGYSFAEERCVCYGERVGQYAGRVGR